MDTNTKAQTKIIRLPEVMGRTGMGRTSIYAWIAQGTFPRQISLGHRATGWLESEIDEWIDQRIQVSRGGRNGTHG